MRQAFPLHWHFRINMIKLFERTSRIQTLVGKCIPKILFRFCSETNIFHDNCYSIYFNCLIFRGVRIVAVILCTTGIALLAYMDGVDPREGVSSNTSVMSCNQLLLEDQYYQMHSCNIVICFQVWMTGHLYSLRWALWGRSCWRQVPLLEVPFIRSLSFLFCKGAFFGLNSFMPIYSVGYPIFISNVDLFLPNQKFCLNHKSVCCCL